MALGWKPAQPTLSASLIVRDEEKALPACLASLADVVDEIHVHDTGSTDATIELARAAGAVVTTGAWTDDFSAARNAALAGWSADWVVWLDADERLTTDRGDLRHFLSTTTAEAVLVEIQNSNDDVVLSHSSIRFFRPERARWSGIVHEQVTARDGKLRSCLAPRALVRVDHFGYHSADVVRAKCQRNALLAQKSLDALVAQGASPEAFASSLLDLGRSLIGAGREQDAVDTLELARETFPGTEQWLQATDLLCRVLLRAGMNEAGLALSEQLREAGARPGYCDWLGAHALAQSGLFELATVLLHSIDDIVDTFGVRTADTALRELTERVERQRQGFPVA